MVRLGGRLKVQVRFNLININDFFYLPKISSHWALFIKLVKDFAIYLWRFFVLLFLHYRSQGVRQPIWPPLQHTLGMSLIFLESWTANYAQKGQGFTVIYCMSYDVKSCRRYATPDKSIGESYQIAFIWISQKSSTWIFIWTRYHGIRIMSCCLIGIHCIWYCLFLGRHACVFIVGSWPLRWEADRCRSYFYENKNLKGVFYPSLVWRMLSH